MGSTHTLAVMITGLPGSGKTFFAKRLSQAMGAVYYSTDFMRKSLGLAPQHNYAEKSNLYHEILSRFETTLRATQTVVMDATFYKADLREQFAETARRAFAKPVWIEIRAGEATIRERLQYQREDSDTDFAVYEWVKAEYEPLLEDHLVLHSDAMPIEEMIAEAMEWLRGKA
jgi:predicted kinase